MSQNQIVQARINREIKNQAAEVLANMGLTISDVMRILLTRVAKEKTLPLEIFSLNRETLQAMEEAENDKDEIVTLDQIRESIRAHN
nr:unnamed protein product [uncultured bacterium]